MSGRRPDAITLGFSPQVLVAALSLLKPGERLVVITSPEVVKGVGPGRLFKRAIDMFSSRLNVKVAPSPHRPSTAHQKFSGLSGPSWPKLWRLGRECSMYREERSWFP